MNAGEANPVKANLFTNEEKIKRATIYVATHRAFFSHCASCESCSIMPPSSPSACALGFTSGLNVRTAHNRMLEAF